MPFEESASFRAAALRLSLSAHRMPMMIYYEKLPLTAVVTLICCRALE
ncbi:Tryptophan synthase alpha chain [Yersinia rohdei ATCC 43380]|nr:Tryptophan synthase alpha chain [Yersinia rohdei ATCC 43380]